MPAGDIIYVSADLGPQWWVRAAQGAVRRHCGWHVAPSVTETLRVDGYGGRTLILPSKHVTAIASVIVGDEDWLDQPLDDTPPASVDTPAVREAWLARIRELVAAERYAEARDSYAEFRRRHPDAPVPADLRMLLGEE